MSSHNKQYGYTIVELVVAMVVLGIVALMLSTFMNTTLRQYLGLQKNATAFSDLTMQSQRMTNVLRGSYDILEATPESIAVYAYFFPNHNKVSHVRYYLNPAKTILYADVTPMTENPPDGVQIPDQKKTYTIIPYYQKVPNQSLFDYYDGVNQPIEPETNNLRTIKAVRINLLTPSDGVTKDGSQSVSTQVSLRNRKNNL